MPFAPIEELNNPHQRYIGDAEYCCQEPLYDGKQNMFKWKDIPGEIVKVHIYLAGPKYNDDKLQADFKDKVSDLKCYLSMFDGEGLAKQMKNDKL